MREKYSHLESHLDEFLFEFMRPCLEAKLAPLYDEFLASPFFLDMQKELAVGERFPWVLSVRHH